MMDCQSCNGETKRFGKDRNGNPHEYAKMDPSYKRILEKVGELSCLSRSLRRLLQFAPSPQNAESNSSHGSGNHDHIWQIQELLSRD